MKYQIATLLLASSAIACGGSQASKSAAPSEPEIEQDDAPPTGHRASVPNIGDDDDDDDGVEIEGLKGYINPYDIQKGVTPHASALARCFEKPAHKQHYLGGTIELSFTVARDGSVKTVRATKSTVGSWQVEHCLLVEGRSMRFKKPKGGEADFSLPLEFDARRQANWWTEAKAESEIAERPLSLQECESESAAPQNVWVTLYVGNRGVVKSAGFASPNKAEIPEQWAACAAAKITTWTLNDPRGKVAKLGFRYNPE